MLESFLPSFQTSAVYVLGVLLSHPVVHQCCQERFDSNDEESDNEDVHRDSRC